MNKFKIDDEILFYDSKTVSLCKAKIRLIIFEGNSIEYLIENHQGNYFIKENNIYDYKEDEEVDKINAKIKNLIITRNLKVMKIDKDLEESINKLLNS